VRTPQLATHSVKILAIPLLVAGLAAGVAPATSAAAATGTAATSNPIVGKWHVTYGNRAVVKMTLKAGKYTERAVTRIRVVDASCYLPVGTVLATFHSTGGRSYAGRHGLWNTSNCSFAYWTPMTLKLSRDGDTLTAVLPAINGSLKFTKITATSR
jgi:hypothetical protein